MKQQLDNKQRERDVMRVIERKRLRYIQVESDKMNKF